MHACLHVDEIVRLIACQLVESQGRATAVALACCCRGFEDPVLDTLWETQHLLTPLLKTFPENVWEGGEYMCFRRLPTTLELARFQKYARRMRNFQDLGTLDGLSSEVLLVLQRFNFTEPLLPNLKTLELWSTTAEFAPFILLFVSPGTTHINVTFQVYDLSKALVASIITPFSARCPNLQHIGLHHLPRDPMITAVVSELLLTTNRDTLRTFDVDSPLTEEAREVAHKLPDLRELKVVTERGIPLPTLVLPSLTELTIEHDHDDAWLEMFRGATLGRLESVCFISKSEPIGDLLGAFERVALTASVQNALSIFSLNTPRSWNPNFSSLLSFTQLKNLNIQFPCDNGCSSRVNDDVIINLARAMPELETLLLGDVPCHRVLTGVTVKGFAVLARHCPNLSTLCVHFQVASLSVLPATIGMAPTVEPTVLRRDCALTSLIAGDIPIPEHSVLMVALTLARIFPRIETILSYSAGWRKVENAIYLSRQIVDCSNATL